MIECVSWELPTWWICSAKALGNNTLSCNVSKFHVFSSRIEELCRSNLIIFLTLRNSCCCTFLVRRRSTHASDMVTQPSEKKSSALTFVSVLLWQQSFPVLSPMSSMWSSWISSVLSVTYLFVRFTIMTQELVSSPHDDCTMISIPSR